MKITGISNDNSIDISLMDTDKGKEELYLYSLKHLAYENSDKKRVPLTNLHSLSAFFFLANEMMRDNPNKTFGLIVMDITQFKALNEFCGREAGDNLLKFIGNIFNEYVTDRPFTWASHIRADNFCLCTAYEDEQELADIAADVAYKIRHFDIPYKVHPSFGICASKSITQNASFMKDCATVALSRIKGKFYADYAFFDDEMRVQMLREKQVESDIVSALENGELVPYIQPKVDMETGKIIGGEALVRWIDRDKGIIPPMQFIPILEKNGFIINVDKAIWEQVFKYIKDRQDRGLINVPISVNLSRVHIYDEALCDTLISLREKYQIDSSLIWLELTESAFLENEQEIFEKMKQLRELGFKVSMDDFGTGYSSLFMLKDQPVDEVKMDRAFILELEKKESRIILEHVASMLNALNKKVIVEGVETAEQKSILLDNGLSDAQGFLFYKPMPLEEFDEVLNKQVLTK